MKKMTYFLVVLIGLLTAAGTETLIMPDIANGATIVNVDATLNDETHAVVQSFGPGTYTVTPTADVYEAWNPWGYVDLNDNKGYINAFRVSSDGPPSFWDSIGDGMQYGTAAEALAGALANNILITFTLAATSDVNFFITDAAADLGDNEGGMSLSVELVPIPGAFWLIGSGFVGLMVVRRKLKKA